MEADTLATEAGLIRVAERVYLCSPTRRHDVLVQWEADRWVTWAGRWDVQDGRGRIGREWTLYQGRDLRQALRAAVRFAGRFGRDGK